MTKLEPTADKGIFVGYSETLKAYRIYIPAKRKVVVRLDVKFEEKRAFRRSWELEYLDSPDPQEQLSQSHGSRGTSITVSSPSVSSGSQSQMGGASGSVQSCSQGSPLMDSSHGTSASTSTGSGMRSAGRPSGV